MLTIIDAGIRRGYSHEDHLIDDAPLVDLCGRSFRSIRAAREALERIIDLTQVRSIRVSSPAWGRVRMADGSVRDF